MPLAGLRRKIATIARAAGVSGAEHRAFEFEILPPSQWAGPRLCAVIGRRACSHARRCVHLAGPGAFGGRGSGLSGPEWDEEDNGVCVRVYRGLAGCAGGGLGGVSRGGR
ncbi:hypothetical protein Bbelb_087250 [Branchiostoma belcheri]|nr:hypothetical protein Bbelb_087250 [Branchiostoma belcheri]